MDGRKARNSQVIEPLQFIKKTEAIGFGFLVESIYNFKVTPTKKLRVAWG